MDGIFGIGPLELVLIAIVALIVLGPERLPSVVREGARYLREIRKLGNELTSQFSDELKVLDEINPQRLINDALNPQAADPPKPARPASPTPSTQPLAPKPAAAKVASAPVAAQATTAPAADDSPAVEPATVSASQSVDAHQLNGNGAGRAKIDEEPAHSILPPPPPEPATSVTSPAAQPDAVAPVDSHVVPPPVSQA